MPIRLLAAILLSLLVSAPEDSSAGFHGAAWWASAVATAFLAAVGLGLWGSLTRRIRRTTDIESLFAWYGRAMALYAWLAIVLYAAVVFLGGWAEAVFAWLPPWRGTDLWIPQRLLILAPYLWLVLITWVIGYRMSSAVRRAAEIGWSGRRWQVRLGRYLVFQMRTQWLVFLVPYGFVLACHNVAVVVWGSLSAEVETVVLAAPMILVYVLSPWLLRMVWSTSRLPDGPLRQRLEAAARRAGVHVRDILVWRTEGLMVNACVAGLGRLVRYVFLTDALIESLQPVQVEAVFAHELGHARFRHIPFFFVVAVGGGVGMSLVASALDALRLPGVVTLGGGVVFLAGYWLGFFGFLSRRFERQSDLFAARTVDCPGRWIDGGCAIHRPESDAAADPYYICGHQAWAFASSLELIAMLNGMATRARSWRHFGIARRIRFVHEAVGRPDLVRRYDRRLRLLKWVFLAVVLAATAAIALLSGIASGLP